MKHYLSLFLFLCFSVAGYSQVLPLKEYTNAAEFEKDLREQYNITVQANRNYSFEILPEWAIWVRRTSFAGFYPAAPYNGLLKRKDASCVIVFGPTGSDQMSSRSSMRYEVFDLLEKEYEYPKKAPGDTNTYIASPAIPKSFNPEEHAESLPGKKANVDAVCYLRLPGNSTAKFLENDLVTPSSLQGLHEKSYPAVYRVYYFKDGRQVFDAIMMLSAKAGEKPRKYIKELTTLFRFDS